MDMNDYTKTIQIRWSDLDPNFHLRHSVYYDWGAFCRIEFLNEQQLTAEVMIKHGFGPILFREECTFRKEIRLGDEVKIHLHLLKARKDYSRWSIQHHITKNNDLLAAIINVDGAWINTIERKLTSPPEIVRHVFDKMPKSEQFEWLAG
jgi:acyl-CoA thioester hydrolase